MYVERLYANSTLKPDEHAYVQRRLVTLQAKMFLDKLNH